MRGSFISLILSLLAWSVRASSATPSCSTTQLCPKDYPCCFEGSCGTGTYCLGGCDPLMSYSPGACTPKPMGHDRTYTWPDLQRATLNTKYLGDASTLDWEYTGSPNVTDNHVVLTMPKNSTGTLMSSTQYIWYGGIATDIKSSRGQGVVTAFILMSDVKDEIDFEWASTWNATSNRYQYPQTPSRMQLSLWPAGRAGSAQGTIDWAGGDIDWNSAGIQDQGYYSASFANITVR
ncbi:concanavalin A-like lectin/glucanase [Aspergillus sclerotiicarbonarius CBS 121057]|uniref:Concanavalin A-like lectin/glucanase n=1 Tax=Aspergillus sclerotiicarbonarius (strain CBS 121057 / IBT 28362) TaxID=1448318 RepID=A0A319DXI5_ASPSB|nr:concanavalin A-like lectin/glucanase [Aspergillus sclerotiicarbonarius CBS 121057]